MKTILITGSSRGIGKAVAQEAHAKGYKVIVHGKTDSDRLDQVHKELNGSVKTFFDVSNKSETQNAIQELIKQHGAIDVLVNNSGIAINFLEDISEVDDEGAIEEFKTNILGPIHCIQAVLPAMKEKGSGSIINIASMKGHPQLSTMSSFTYGTTKSGVISLTKSLAKKYSESGIRVNSVSPGYVDTDILAHYDEATRKKRMEGILLNRFADPKEIAYLVLFLASDEAGYITGEDILIDGGYKLKGK